MTVDVYIGFCGNASKEDAYELTHLADFIKKECDVFVQIEREKPGSGVKNGGLAVGIAITNLMVTSIGTIFATLAYWNSKKTKYSISVTRDNVTESIGNLDFKQYQQEIAMLPQDHRIQINIKI